MSEKSTWDDYLSRVGWYLDMHDLRSEELDYKRETAQELARIRAELLDQKGPISKKQPKHLNNLGGQYNARHVWQWLGTADGADALRELWAPHEQSTSKVPPVVDVLARISAFSQRLPGNPSGGKLKGAGTRMRPISVLLMALDVDQYPPFKTTEFNETYALMDYPASPNGTDEAALYRHAIAFLDRFIEEAKKRDRDMPSNRLEAQSLVWALGQGRDGTTAAEDEADRNGAESSDPGPASTVPKLAGELLLPSDFLTNIEVLLDDKRQVIFQGPPGTGKTCVARALADCLAGAKERVRLVQFHPSYSYEDFVQGFRPALRGGQPAFELRNGPLVKVAEQAKAEPKAKHFLVIDEINRGWASGSVFRKTPGNRRARPVGEPR